MVAYALSTDGRPVRQLTRSIQRYLPGLDVRLQQYSPLQAIMPAHLLHALQLEYGDASALLKGLGAHRIEPLSDEQVVAVLRARDARDLAPKPKLGPLALKSSTAPDALDWHLSRCGVGEAWKLLGGPEKIDWGDISVGQIDTGYTRHPALGFPGDSWVRTALAKTFWPDPPQDSAMPPMPELGDGLDNLQGFNGGHGTRIGCTIAGWAPKERYYGVAPKVPLVPVRICEFVVINDRQREFDQAVRHLVDVAKVQVINVSLGLVPSTTMKQMKRALNHAYEQGVIVVCAAGNYVSSVVSPASLRRTLAAGGVTAEDWPWSGSSHGPEVDLSAPAADIRRADCRPGGQYGYAGGGDGTSYATAMISGAAALWLAHHRQKLSKHYAEPWQVVEAFKIALRATARSPAVWQPGSFGVGVLAARALLECTLPPASTLQKDDAI